MSRGQNFSAFNASVRSALTPDVGPVESDPCGVDPCDWDAVYRVPWPSVGGDVANCGYHLARYREQHPELVERAQEAVDEDLTAYATRGTRFLTFDAVPETLFDETFDAIARPVHLTFPMASRLESVGVDGRISARRATPLRPCL